MKWIIGFFTLSILAVFTSQSLVDLSDILITFGALILAFKRKELKSVFTNFKPAWLWPVWLLIVVTGLVVNVGFDDTKAWNEFFEFRWILTFLGIIYLGLQIEPQKHKLIQIWAYLLIGLNIIALILFAQDPHWRVQGILKQTMSFSHNIAPLLCLFSIYLVGNWNTLVRREKLLVGVVVITSAALTLFTFTRGVWIGSAVAILTALLIWNKRVFAGALIAGGLIGAIVLASNQRVYDRVFNKTTNETQSNDERKALWMGNWRMIQDFPILGVGFQQNKYHLRKYYDEFGLPAGQRESHAHNQYLQVWAGTGTLGFICFLAFLFLVLKKSYQGFLFTYSGNDRFWQLGLFAAILCFMVGAMTESNFNIAKNRLLFLLLAGLAVAQALKNKKTT